MTVSERCSECLESSDVTRQFEYSQDAENAKYLRGFCNVLQRVLRRELVENQRDEDWENSEEINDIEEGQHESKLKKNIIQKVLNK